MKKTLSFILSFLVFSLISFGQIVGTGQLKISINDTNNGVAISSILDGNDDILHEANEIFSLDIRNVNTNAESTITSSSNWGTTNVDLSNGGANMTIILSNPTLVDLPASLVATVTIQTDDKKSEWDLTVSGLGANYSLMDAIFPHLNMEGNGGTFLIPRYSGQEIDNPAGGIDYFGIYPRGNATNMQFLAYYGAGNDVYFGFHDPSAAFKNFDIDNIGGGVRLECELTVPNRSLPGNNWDFPGHFELDLFDGDWYHASMIYKEWASNNADYWPENTDERQLRQAEIGKIGIWFYDIGYYNGNSRTAASIQTGTQKCIDYLPGIPIVTHLYTWWGEPNDDDYPELFPAIAGLDASITTLHNNGALVVPYFNGRLWDTGLASFNPTGLPNATKRENGDYYFQNFDNSDGQSIHFGVMCPDQPVWQDIVINAMDVLTNDINAGGVYLDQVSAAAGLPCMDPNHNHTLGGGSFWRDGYQTMFSGVHAAIPDDRFVTVEGACDFLLDEVDGVLVDPWDKANMVPAYSAVYSGRVQMFGTRTGTGSYNNASFYAQLAQTFSFGIQPGRFTTYIMDDPNSQAMSKPYIKTLATMRYKLHEFMSFGEMKYPPSPIAINPDPIPTITSDWGTGNVTISAIQSSLWQRGDSVAVVLANAAMNGGDQEFSFDFEGGDFGMIGDLLIKEVTELDDGTYTTIDNSFSQAVTMSPREIKAYIIKAANPLPITLIAPLTGMKKDNHVVLRWKTGNEVNFKGFGIERSINGVDWKNIGNIETSGISNNENSYSYIDKSPFNGLNYYRLKEIDNDDSFSYSNIVNVQFYSSIISIFPNPSSGQIIISSSDIAISQIKVYNQLGQLVLHEDNPSESINISHLPKDVYKFVLLVNGEMISKMVVLE